LLRYKENKEYKKERIGIEFLHYIRYRNLSLRGSFPSYILMTPDDPKGELDPLKTIQRREDKREDSSCLLL
jgi:hypothetical protein